MSNQESESPAQPRNAEPPPHKPRPCPICKAPSARDYRPFCSRRCADVDLSRWLSGRYAIAGGDADEDEDGDLARADDLMQGRREDEY